MNQIKNTARALFLIFILLVYGISYCLGWFYKSTCAAILDGFNAAERLRI